MTNLKIVANASRTLTLVQELRDAGYIQGTDFEFTFNPSIQDRFSGPTKPSYVLFRFRQEELSTFYRLKWIDDEV
jgi:hypothetical protein